MTFQNDKAIFEVMRLSQIIKGQGDKFELWGLETERFLPKQRLITIDLTDINRFKKIG